MNEQILTIIGVAGNVLLVASYLPQIFKILKTKHANDLSIIMWISYLFGDGLLLTYAIFKNEAIVASLFTIMTIGNIIILILTLKYGHVKKLEFGKKKSPQDEVKNPVTPKL